MRDEEEYTKAKEKLKTGVKKDLKLIFFGLCLLIIVLDAGGVTIPFFSTLIDGVWNELAGWGK